MITKTGGSGKKSDDSTSKMIPSPPSPKNPVVYSFNRPTFESILNEYPELVQFFELRQVVPTYEPDSNISKSKNTTSKSRPSTQNGKFSFNKIFNFSSNKSEQKGIFGFGKNKNKNNTNSNNKSTSPPPSTVRESLQRSALSLSNSLEINDLIEKKLRRDFITINEEIKNIPKINFNYNKIPDKRSRKKNQNLNTNALTYSYLIKILTYLKYQERLKICEAQHDHCEKHKKYIQNLLEIVNIVNKEYPNSDLIINGKLLNYSIMNDEKLLLAAAAAQSSQASNSSPPSPIQNLHKTEIGSTVKNLREKTMKHEKRKNLLSYKIKILIAKENSSRSTLINDLINKLFNIDSNGSITSSTPNTNSIAKKEIKSNPIKRRSKLNRGRKTSPSATKSYSSSNLMQLSRRQSDITTKNDNSDIPSALADKKERKSFNDLDENDNYNDDENKDTSPISKNLQNPHSVSKSSSSSTLFQTSDQNNLSDDRFDIHSDNYNDNKLKNFDNNNYSPITTNTVSIPTFEDENDIIFNNASRSVSNMKLTDFDEAIKELASNESSDKIPPLNTSNSDLLNHINRTAVKDPCASSDDIILSDSESIQNKNIKLEDDYEYSLYSDNELELNENDENLTEFQNLDENDILFEKTLTYIEDNDGQFLDFELLIEKASECTEFKSELISVTIRKIKKSPKDSGINILKLCQIFMDVFLEFEKKREQQILQQTKMERDAIIASQKNKVMPVNSYGLVPYTVQSVSSTTSTNNANNKNGGSEICNKEEEEEKQKDVMRFLFVMFSKYIFNEIYTTTFHQEFFYMQDFLFSNSILNGLDQIPSITNELMPVLPYLPTDLHDLRIRDFTEYESFRDYSKCVEDVMMLQFESSLVDFCYVAFKILDRIQKIASAILFDKKIEAELEKQRDGFASSYHGPSNFIPMGGINSDNYSNKSKPTENKQNQVNSTSDNERGNSNSLPKATISGINFGDTNDEESSNNKFISSSPSNSSVSIQKDSSSMYSSKKSQMQLRADCQLSCDQLCDITTVIVIIAGPFDLRKLIDLYSPFVNGLRLSSQLEFAFLTFQSVCSNILESFNPMSTNNTIKRKKRKEEQRMKREEEQRIQAEKENEQRQKQSENEQQKEEENQDQINSEEN